MFLMLLSRTAGGWNLKLIIPSLLAIRSLDGKTAKNWNICLCEGLPGRVPPQPLTSTPSAAQPQKDIAKKSSRRKRAWGEIANDSKQFLRTFLFFSLEWKKVTPWGWDFYQKEQKSAMSDERHKKALRLKYTVPDPAQSECSSNHHLRTQNKKRTSSGSPTRANSWRAPLWRRFSKGWKSSVMIPILGYIKDKMDKIPRAQTVASQN